MINHEIRHVGTCFVFTPRYTFRNLATCFCFLCSLISQCINSHMQAFAIETCSILQPDISLLYTPVPNNSKTTHLDSLPIQSAATIQNTCTMLFITLITLTGKKRSNVANISILPSGSTTTSSGQLVRNAACQQPGLGSE